MGVKQTMKDFFPMKSLPRNVIIALKLYIKIVVLEIFVPKYIYSAVQSKPSQELLGLTLHLGQQHKISAITSMT